MAKKKTTRDERREDRIIMEIVVDAYDHYERAMGWYCYLQNQLRFPFTAKCVAKRSISPLAKNDQIQVVGLADADECDREIFVTIVYEGKRLDVPLAQLHASLKIDAQTNEAIEDWHYWTKQGYEF